MREIELKFKIDDKEKFQQNLKNKNCQISEIIDQKDTIYVSDLENTESTEGSIWLRVRKTNETIELNLKKQSSKKMESQEIEFEVNSYEKANEFLSTLGYQKWVEVHKKRQYSKYKECNICMDEVEKLGYFVEIELLIEESDLKDYEDQLLKIANELGIDTKNRINSHYDTMISELENE